MTPALPKLVSWAGEARRSSTVTSNPASRRYQAEHTPITPAPITMARMGIYIFICAGR